MPRHYQCHNHGNCGGGRMPPHCQGYYHGYNVCHGGGRGGGCHGWDDNRDHYEKPCHDCHNARANDTDQFSEEESDNDVATLKNIEKLLSKLTKKVAILEKKIEN